MEQFKFYEGDERFKELKEIYTEKINFLSNSENILDAFDKPAEFAHSLSQKYPNLNLRVYKLFHLISHSSFAEIDVPFWDLPEGEIEEFIRNL